MSQRNVTLCLFVLIAGLALPRSAMAQAPNPNYACSRIKLDRQPGWTNSGSWAASGDTLLVADALRKEILEYPINGGASRVLDEPISPVLKRLSPSMIRGQGSRLFIEVSGDRILTLDRNRGYSLLRQSSLHAKGASTGGELAGMFMWEPAGSDLIAFSDLNGPQGRWHSAFVRFPADKPSQYTELWPYDFQEPTKTFYRLGHPYIASIGATGYVLLIDKMGIYRSRATGTSLERLSAFPEGLDRTPPSLPSFTTASDFAPVMRAVERSAMPTGLYSWGSFLYVLAREPRRAGGTRWTLTQVDPNLDRVVAEFEVPSQANHLTVVPGPKAWAFIEKGPVKSFGRQEIRTVLFVPSQRFGERKVSQALCGDSDFIGK